MPGKFEGEPEYAEYFYQLSLDGGDEVYYDEHDRQIDEFELTTVEHDQYAELSPYNHLLLWEDDNGFVYTKVFSTRKQTNDFLIGIGIDPQDLIT